jgi:hypothetical protein
MQQNLLLLQMQHRNVASLEKVEFESMWDVLEKVGFLFTWSLQLQYAFQKIEKTDANKFNIYIWFIDVSLEPLIFVQNFRSFALFFFPE